MSPAGPPLSAPVRNLKLAVALSVKVPLGVYSMPLRWQTGLHSPVDAAIRNHAGDAHRTSGLGLGA